MPALQDADGRRDRARDYECHSCGREFAAGLVRVPRAGGRRRGDGRRPRSTALPYPEAAVVEEDVAGRAEPDARLGLPDGRSCSAAAAARTSARSRARDAVTSRLGVVWLDAHGDLNTPESSPSGNEWGMPLRMAARRRRGRPTGRRARRRARPRPTRARLHRGARGIQTGQHARRPRAPRSRLRLRRARLRRARAGSDVSSFMPVAGRPPTSTRSRAALRDISRPRDRSSAPGSPALRPTRTRRARARLAAAARPLNRPAQDARGRPLRPHRRLDRAQGRRAEL